MSNPLQRTPFYFEDHRVGYRVECGAYTVHKSEVIEFAQKWDPQPWHIDETLAQQSIFGGLTACSAHIFSIYCITSPQWQNGAVQQAVASLGFDDLRMHKPVYAGDRLRCITVVDEARASNSKPDCGIVIYASELLNQHDDSVFSIKCSTLMARRTRHAH
ncbi:MAG: MaoC family dehydratase N-terminal domain-containing protein [Halioglobus sp.]|nr:MaoC family dehydratase N-terminal domain-containing protein [Halioglobus sp.]